MSFVNPFDDAGNSLSHNGIAFSFSYFQHIPNPQNLADTELKLLCKALLKSNLKTKLKSLTGLLAYFDPSSGVNSAKDSSFIPFFIQIYPKLSIINDKAIRSSAHKLAATLVATFGKQIAPYLKNIVPVWLLGLFDPDKMVALDTNKSMLQCFNNSIDKKNNLFKIFQRESLELIDHFLKYETIDTLVDKASTSNDEANLIYTRTLSAIINLINYYVANSLVQKNQDLLEPILSNNDQLWVYLSNNSSDYNYLVVKKSLLTLLNSCLVSKEEPYKKMISLSVIVKNVFKLIKFAPSNKNFYGSIVTLILISLINLNLSSLKEDSIKKFKTVFISFLNAYFSSTSRDYFSYLLILYNKLAPSVINFASVGDFNSFLKNPLQKSEFKLNYMNRDIQQQFFNFFSKVFSNFYQNIPAQDAKQDLLQFLSTQIVKNGFNVQYSTTLNLLDSNDLEMVLNGLEDHVTVSTIHNWLRILQTIKSTESVSKSIQSWVSKLESEELIEPLSKLQFKETTESLATNAPVQTAANTPNTATATKAKGNVLLLATVRSLIQLNFFEIDLNKSLTIRLLKSNVTPLLSLDTFDTITEILYSLDKNWDQLVLKNLSEFDVSTLLQDKISQIVNWSTNIHDDDDIKSAKLAKTLKFLSDFSNSRKITSPEIEQFVKQQVIVYVDEATDIDTALKISFKYSDDSSLALFYSQLFLSNNLDNIVKFWDNFLRYKDVTALKSFSDTLTLHNSNFKNNSYFIFFWDYLANQHTEKETSLSLSADISTVTKFLGSVEEHIGNDKALFEIYTSSLTSTILSNIDNKSGYNTIVNYFMRRRALGSSIVEQLIPSTQNFISAIALLFDLNQAYSLCLTMNSLNHYLYLIRQASEKRDIDQETSKFKFTDVAELAIYYKLILDLVFTDENKVLPPDELSRLLVDIAAVASFAEDYIFYGASHGNTNDTKNMDNLEMLQHKESVEDSLLNFNGNAFNALSKEFKADIAGEITNYQLQSLIFENQPAHSKIISYISLIIDSDQHSATLKFYHAKVLQKLLVSNVTHITVNDSAVFFSLINKQLIKNKDYLKLDALLPLFPSILSDQHLENLKKTILSEILGIRSFNNDTRVHGLASLSILNHLLSNEAQTKDTVVLPKIQLNMLIRAFQQWFSSDISYDIEFIPVRIQVVIFFQTLLLHTSSFNESLDFVVDDLFKDSLSIVSSSLLVEGPSADTETSSSTEEISLNVNLNYGLLMLFSALNAFFAQNEELADKYWDKSSQADVHEEFSNIITGFLSNKYLHKYLLNQRVIFTIDLLKRYIDKNELSINSLEGQFNSLVDTLTQDGPIGRSSNFAELERFNVFIVDKLLSKLQKDFIVEFALNYKSIIGDAADNDNNEDNDNGNQADTKIFKIPQPLLAAINDANVPHEFIENESYSITLQYLWSWLEILRFFYDNIPGYVHKIYLNQLPDQAIEKLLDFIFKQIDITSDPLIDLKQSSVKELETMSTVNKPRLSKMINDMQNYNFYSLPYNGSESLLIEIKILLFHIFYLVLLKFRQQSQSWYLNIRNKQLKSSIEIFTAKYFSLIIIDTELNRFQQLLNDAEKKKGVEENHIVKVNKTSNEVKSQYLIDEQSTELIIKLGKAFPLTNVSIDAPNRIGVKEIVWRSWILACLNLINNGRVAGVSSSSGASQGLVGALIYDAIELFDKNINLHFKGFEECAICYAILHIQDKSLPTKSCQTCHNKFHSGCLLKWFKSSGNNTCPLCRGEFNFRVGAS